MEFSISVPGYLSLSKRRYVKRSGLPGGPLMTSYRKTHLFCGSLPSPKIHGSVLPLTSDSSNLRYKIPYKLRHHRRGLASPESTLPYSSTSFFLSSYFLPQDERRPPQLTTLLSCNQKNKRREKNDQKQKPCKDRGRSTTTGWSHDTVGAAFVSFNIYYWRTTGGGLSNRGSTRTLWIRCALYVITH